MALQVETHAGYKADERPVRFRWNDRQFEITQILDRWYGPDYSYFRVLADDGNTYILRQDWTAPEGEQWTLASYRRGV
jgi:hypothetical protein